MLHFSSDSGVTWQTRGGPVPSPSFIQSSADGTRLALGGSSGPAYVSNDSGVTWTMSNSSIYTSLGAISADGTKMVVAPGMGEIFYAKSMTTLGTAGSITGSQYQNIELQYFGNGLFSVVSSEGDFLVE